MKHSLLVMTLLATLAVAAPAAAQDRRLFVNGDSLAVGTEPYFPGALPGWSIRTSASISRHAFEGPGVLRSMGSALPPVIAVSLGTNDDPRHTAGFRNAIRQTMAVAGPSRCVVWATINRPPVAGTPYTAYNTLLREEGAAAAEPVRRPLAPARAGEPAVARGRRRARRRDRLPGRAASVCAPDREVPLSAQPAHDSAACA